MSDKDNGENKRPAARKPLREEVADIDRQILRLLLKRHNLLEKMSVKGKINPNEEKFLRESWQTAVAKISRDAELSGRFFSLMQNVGFLPKPEPGKDQEKLPGSQRREAFNLAPPRHSVDIALTAPLDSLLTRAWLYMAAASGMPMRLSPSAQNDPIVDCVKALDQMGGAITREEDALTVRAAAPLGVPDKVIHAGDSEFNLFLFIAHYLGRPSRVKISGETRLKLADFSILRHLLPQLGTRMTHVVPRSEGLPIRLECSGLLPPQIDIPPELPDSFAMALLLAAPFYSTPFSINLENHPHKNFILALILPVLDSCGITYLATGDAVNIQPGSPSIPVNPRLSADVEITSNLLALTAPLGGKAILDGFWPEWAAPFWKALQHSGLNWDKTSSAITANQTQPLKTFDMARIPDQLLAQIPEKHLPLFVALAVCAALNGGNAVISARLLEEESVADFLRFTHIVADADGRLSRTEEANETQPWNAPTSAWAMALALAALSRGKSAGFALGNPGLLLETWPSWWACYNSLPNPRLKKNLPPKNESPAKRRRILTEAVAVPPEIKEEDWN